MTLTVSSSDVIMRSDQLAQILKICTAIYQEGEATRTPEQIVSLKLDLRAIQEVEAMEGYATEADFEELLFVPKVQDFLTQTPHEAQAVRAFWLLLRMRYLALLSRAQRAQVIQTDNQRSYKCSMLLAEFYKLPQVTERLRLLSRLPYRDFAAFVAETDRRALPLKADSAMFLHSIAFHPQNSEVRQSARRTFLAR